MMSRTTFIVNLFGGPGTGKSTTAANLFSRLKLAGVSCELVTEYAKEMTWASPDSEHPGLLDSLDLLAQQSLRQRRLIGQVDYVITDSPLPLIVCFQDKGHFAGMEWFSGAVMQTFSLFNNINISLERVKTYDPIGRNQTEEQAWDIDKRVLELPILWTLKLAANEYAGKKIARWITDGHEYLRDAVAQAEHDIKFNTPDAADIARVFGETSGPGETG